MKSMRHWYQQQQKRPEYLVLRLVMPLRQSSQEYPVVRMDLLQMLRCQMQRQHLKVLVFLFVEQMVIYEI